MISDTRKPTARCVVTKATEPLEPGVGLIGWNNVGNPMHCDVKHEETRVRVRGAFGFVEHIFFCH
jgi:hypothetical protein